MRSLWRSMLVLTIAAAFLFTILLQTTSAASWNTPVIISNPNKRAIVPTVAMSNNGKLHAAWTEITVSEAGFMTDFEIYYARSLDNGASWSSPINISSSPNNFSGEPVIAIADDQSSQIHIVWEEYNTAGDPDGTEVFYARSTDEGVTWPASNIRNVSNRIGPSGSPYVFVDATASHGVHVTWSDYGTDGYGQIYYSKSADGGGSFSSALNTSNNTDDNDQPAVISDSVAIHLVWQNNGSGQIYYSRSTNGGSSFTSPQVRSQAGAFSNEPTVTLDAQNRVHLAWTQFNDVGGSDIFWASSSDNGATFAAGQNRTNNPATISQTPSIASPGGGRVMIIWNELQTDGTFQNFLVNSANGTSWQATEPVAGPASRVFEPALVMKGSTLNLVWEEDSRIKFSRGS